MLPAYHDGDYVIVRRFSAWRWGSAPKVGDDVVCRHPRLGVVLKRIESIRSEKVSLTGLNSLSSSSDAIGLVCVGQLVGRVVAHVRRPRPGKSEGQIAG